MTHSELLYDFLKQNGGQATLHELIQNGAYTYAHKLGARIADLRKQGFQITCEKGPNPSKNLYRLTEKPENQYQYEGNQGLLIA